MPKPPVAVGESEVAETLNTRVTRLEKAMVQLAKAQTRMDNALAHLAEVQARDEKKSAR